MTSAYIHVGSAHAAQKKYDVALRGYERAVKQNSRSIELLMLTATIYELKGEKQKSNEYYEKILDIKKNFAPAANNLAWNMPRRWKTRYRSWPRPKSA